MRTLLIALLTMAAALMPAADTAAQPRKVLMVVTSHAVLGATGYPTGLWLTEAAHPWQELVHAGFQVDIASPVGGAVPVDPYSDPRTPVGMTKQDLAAWGFLVNPATAKALSESIPLASVDAAAYDAIVVAGGNGAIFDLGTTPALQTLIARMWADGKVVGTICHGTAALLDVRVADGSHLIAGKRITGFTNQEEAIAQKAIGAEYLPYYIETEAGKRGASFVAGAPFSSQVVVDGRLITGQQNMSGTAFGAAVVAALRGGR
jgi:putative intracellular protease/amidase